MKISKVINNNVLSAFDENGQEVVLMGRGLGFKAKTGDDIDESRVQKVFCIENSALSRQFQEMISNIPMEHMQISADYLLRQERVRHGVKPEYLRCADGSHQFRD